MNFIILKLNENKIIQASNFVSSLINYNFSESHVKKGNELDMVINNLNTFVNNLKLNDAYDERIELLEKIISTKNYEDAIKYYNNKGLLKVIEDILGLKSGTYKYKALDFLKINKEAQKILKSVLPSL